MPCPTCGSSRGFANTTCRSCTEIMQLIATLTKIPPASGHWPAVDYAIRIAHLAAQTAASESRYMNHTSNFPEALSPRTPPPGPAIGHRGTADIQHFSSRDVQMPEGTAAAPVTHSASHSSSRLVQEACSTSPAAEAKIIVPCTSSAAQAAMAKYRPPWQNHTVPLHGQPPQKKVRTKPNSLPLKPGSAQPSRLPTTPTEAKAFSEQGAASAFLQQQPAQPFHEPLSTFIADSAQVFATASVTPRDQ